ncbi:hypothetical protein [Azotosporobacter soli]|uniref:VgrG-related protein n=1 Tax=Azotosporobacter soli TaxID=3055040 RepID=UPI0031FE97C2
MVSLRAEIGLVYGRYQMTVKDAQRFVEWLLEKDHPYGYLLAGYGSDSREFSAAWLDIDELDERGFDEMQREFCQRTVYH